MSHMSDDPGRVATAGQQGHLCCLPLLQGEGPVVWLEGWPAPPLHISSALKQGPACSSRVRTPRLTSIILSGFMCSSSRPWRRNG